MAITKQSIGAHLVGLPPSAQRGLHNLFKYLFDEIEQLRGGVPKAEVTPPSSDVLPPVSRSADPLQVEPVLTTATALPTAVDQFAPPAATGADVVGDPAVANADTTDASADLPPAA